jgi:hypothetical protein
MDWIEQIFHISPDGGNGALEAVYFAVAVLGIAGFTFRRRIRRWIGADRRLNQLTSRTRRDRRGDA